MRPVRDATSHDYLPNLEYNFLVSCKIQSTLTLPGQAAASRVDQPQRSPFSFSPLPLFSPSLSLLVRRQHQREYANLHRPRCSQIAQLSNSCDTTPELCSHLYLSINVKSIETYLLSAELAQRCLQTIFKFN